MVRLDSIASCDTKFRLVGGQQVLHRDPVEEVAGSIQVSGDSVPSCWIASSAMVEIVKAPALQVKGRDKPVAEVSPTADGIKVRVGFELRPDMWVEVYLSEDYIKQLLAERATEVVEE